MKKIFLCLLCGVLLLGVTGCGTKKLEDMTLLERIEAAQTFDEITSCNSCKNGVQPETDEEEKALSKKAKEYILNNNLNKYSLDITLEFLKDLNLYWSSVDISYLQKILNIIQSFNK